jgi:hypothetical protein
MGLMQQIMSSLLLGIIFLRLGYEQTAIQSRTGIIAFLCIGFAFGNIIAASHKCRKPHLSFLTKTVPGLKVVYLRDRRSKLYHVSSFWIAMVATDFLFQILLPLVGFNIIYWLSNLNSHADRYFISLFFVVLIFQVCTIAGIAVNSITTVPS